MNNEAMENMLNALSGMGVMADWEIHNACIGQAKPMIDPYVDHQVKALKGSDVRLMSYGVSSYGYDMRLAGDFKIFTNLHYGIIDPKDFNALKFHDINAKDAKGVIIIPPNSFALASSMEYFRIPENVVGIVLGKSTYARCGLIANITALEPGWEGNLTIELSNTSPLPLRVYAYEGIAQAIFFRGQPCLTTYASRAGKYQGQTGITLPKV